MKNLKVSDGDLILVTLHGADERQGRVFKEGLLKWINGRGLKDVTISLSLIRETNNVGMEIVILSVNDVFENKVLNG